ncbi:hypothetical protein FBY33_3627 [Arthrobacter sp. SLBN-112]|uniref:hypothetical protein n=1 Tax=Arthrobacter sp. SLBN-112 TaxID=2768452 RepID=UPI00114D52F4|nr:hypothetical protein [Arthrobacter sp. SLBN-112]TQJ41512.1 hypothetical protein FBY33_3627 [Arthrobacter sp. SLBN-112]
MSRGSEDLEAKGIDQDEAEAVAVPERSGGLTTGGGAERISLGYLHTVHPESGNDVVFVPGEALPDWAVAVQNEQLAARLRPRAAADDDASSGRRAIKHSASRGSK